MTQLPDQARIDTAIANLHRVLEAMRTADDTVRELLGEPLGYLVGFQYEQRWQIGDDQGRLFLSREQAEQRIRELNELDNEVPEYALAVLEVRRAPDA